jgi:hypothetical protein
VNLDGGISESPFVTHNSTRHGRILDVPDFLFRQAVQVVNQPVDFRVGADYLAHERSVALGKQATRVIWSLGT